MLPSFDYAYTPEKPVLGGELNFDVNARVMTARNWTRDSIATDVYAVRGIEGEDSRVTAEAEWKRTFITGRRPGDNTAAAFQGDTSMVDDSDMSAQSIREMAMHPRNRCGHGYSQPVLSLHGDRRNGTALACPVLDQQRHPCAGADGANLCPSG